MNFILVVKRRAPAGFVNIQNGVSERRNRTLLGMVRSMFNLTTLPLSIWDYALESAVRILNMVLTKKVDMTPYKIWHGKAPNLSYLKVWGCEAYVKYDHMDTLPSKNTSEIPVQPKSLGPPSELIPVRRSKRTTRAPNRLYLNMKVEDDEVGDLGEPANYKTIMLDPDKVTWQGAMDEEMKSMKVNKVWIVVDRPPNAKVFTNKLLYKKKIDMDGKKGFIPMEVKHDLSNEMCSSSDEEKAYTKKVPYVLAVGSIMYAVRCTRPDVAFAQNLVSRYQQNPRKLHWVVVKHILKYLRNTKDMFLVYKGNPDTELEVTGFCDASWQCDKDDTKS
nr:retrotransposon protein, putative, Ty1-copia subclass [Tanacetum cinerariifolium]